MNPLVKLGLALGALFALGDTRRDRPRIWLIGDSIGVGLASAMRRAKVEVDDSTINGSTTKQWVGLLRNITRGNTWAVVSLGTNDAVDKALRREFATNTEAIVNELRARNCRVIWLLPPSASSMIPAQTDLERLTQLDASFMQLRPPMADTWHPTAAGYDMLAAAILGKIQ